MQFRRSLKEDGWKMIDPKAKLLERERFGDPEPGAPEEDDQSTEPHALHAVPGGSHHRDDLLDARRIRRVAKTFVARWPPGGAAGDG